MTLKELDGPEAGERTVPAPDALTGPHPQRKEPIGYFPSDHEIAAARRLLERRARDDARSQLFFEADPENGGKVTSKHPMCSSRSCRSWTHSRPDTCTSRTRF
jgi:hypothetical protein